MHLLGLQDGNFKREIIMIIAKHINGKTTDGRFLKDFLPVPDGYFKISDEDRVPSDLSEWDTEEFKNNSTQKDANKEAREFLSEGGFPGQKGTGWKVTRHRDNVENGDETSLTDEEFKALLTERQAKRDLVIEV